MPRTPVQIRTGRSFGDVLRAVLACVALAMLLVGVPGALAYFVGWPLPRSAPSSDMLRQDISTDVFIKVLAVAVWFAWAQFAACVLVEAKAAVSGVGVPGRVPGSGPSQLLARNLIATLLLMSTAAASYIPVIGQIGNGFDQPPSQTVAAAQQTPGQQAESVVPAPYQEGERAERTDRAEKSERAEKQTKFYRIQPPEGRHHDTLWGASERHLGDGLRYKEIYELNKDRIQPDGTKLTKASLIRPGWIMEMPADARGGELVELPDEVPELDKKSLEEIKDYQGTDDSGSGAGGGSGGDSEAAPDSDSGSSPDSGSGSSPDSGEVAPSEQRPDAEHAIPNDPEPGPPVRDDHAVYEQPGVMTGADDSDSAFGLPEVLLGAPLLAAGLLGALGRRRRHALWQSMSGVLRRSVGNEFDPPTGTPADVRDALLVGADPGAVRFLDRALRGLSAALAADGKPLPAVYAAWLGEHELHLQLAAETGTPPAPWRVGQSSTFWSVERSDIEALADESVGDAVAPYPGLVSLGVRGDVRLLLNLESVPGIVSVTGTHTSRTAVLASVAAELATSGWSDRMTVTVVGFGAELTTLAPTRMRHVEDIAGLLEVMEAETRVRSSQLRGAGLDNVLTGRAAPVRHQQWAPHLVLVGSDPSEEEAEQLAALASGSDQLGLGYLVGTSQEELQGAVWEFTIEPDGKLHAPVMGLELDAQLLPEAQRAAVVELFTSMDAPPEPGGRVEGPSFTVDLSEHGRPAVYARIMGPYEITGLDSPDDARSPLLHEALALLLLHREGVHPLVLASALWPRGVTGDVRDALLSRLRDWVGTGPDGQALLTFDATGRLILAANVVCDWDVLRTLHQVVKAGETKVEQPNPARRHRLTEALGLARGHLLPERPEGRYGWLSHEIVEAQYPVLVADVGLALAAEHLAAEQPTPALHAIHSALVIAPTDERLWNELVRTAHATGEVAELQATVSWLLTMNSHVHGPGRGLPSRTEALLDELVPHWRDNAAVQAGR